MNARRKHTNWENQESLYKKSIEPLYVFAKNDSADFYDRFGLASASVGNCEIVILYGHGSASKPHSFSFSGPDCTPDQPACSAAHFVGCESKATNDKIPSCHQIAGAPSTEDELNSGPGNRDDPDNSFDIFMEKTWAAARARATSICGCKCGCKSVTIRAKLAGSAWWPGNWNEPGEGNYPDETIKCGN